MTAGKLLSEYGSLGLIAGGTLVFDASTALAPIDRAEQEYIAVVGVDPLGSDDLDAYEPMERRVLSDAERIRSWESARAFIEALSDRGLYFEVMLETAFATYLAKLKYLFRTGAAWSSDSSDDGSWLQ